MYVAMPIGICHSKALWFLWKKGIEFPYVICADLNGFEPCPPAFRRGGQGSIPRYSLLFQVYLWVLLLSPVSIIPPMIHIHLHLPFGSILYHCIYGCMFYMLLFNFVSLCILIVMFWILIMFMYYYCFVCSVLCILFHCVVLRIVWCKCVLYYCHRASTQLQLTSISYHIS
jgi:hypothetical protein